MGKVTKMKPGGLSTKDIIASLNKASGGVVAYNLSEDNPTEVKEWIPTGSRWLDSIACKGRYAGIPVGKISEIAGLEATGKSFMAAQIAANAQKMGCRVAYFDSESAIDPDFLRKAGCDLDDEEKGLIYVQAHSVEMVMETIENLLKMPEKWLFIWDSLALTPSVHDIESDYNPQSSMAMKARVLSKGMPKLVQPIANAGATLLVLNQLKTNITRSPSEAMTTPYMTPGGKTLPYSYSLRIWLTGRKAKASFVTDENGFRIGSEVKCKIEKSRFGSTGRTCNFKILWGDASAVGVQDKESWFDAIQISENLEQSGAWYSLVHEDGTREKFQRAHWLKKLEDEKFHKRVLQIMDDDVIMKFSNKTGNASDFYDQEEDTPPKTDD
jgi:recombination protein RecA